MATTDRSFTIIKNHAGQEPTTIKTGLSEPDAREWLRRKATEAGQSLTPDLTVRSPGGEVWSAVEAE